MTEPIGWMITDPDGNVVDSGPITEAHATAWVGEMLAEAARNQESAGQDGHNEGERE